MPFADPARAAEYAREHRLAHLEAYRETGRRWYREVGRYQVFGITKEDFEALLESQGGVCAICGSDESGGKGWQIDHDRSCCPQTARAGQRLCGKCVRGVLCQGCNIALGRFRDDPDRLRAALRYLDG